MKFKQGLVVLMMCSMFMPIIVVASEQGIQSDASISEDWLSKTLEQIKRDEYNPSMQNADYKGEHFSEPRYHFANREQNLRAYLDENGMELMPRVINEEDSWNLKYHINSIYRTKDDIRIYDNIEPKLSDNKVVYKYQDMTLKYTNSEEGIGQSIIIQERCDGEEKLFIKVEMETQDLLLTQSGNDRVIFSHNGNEIIYRIKKIEDAEKRILSSSIDYDEDAQIAIFIDDENAVYPVYVELLISSNSKDAGEWTFTTNNRKGLSETPDWTAESDQADAHFGILVSQAGDVNGDGYSDVIVGAHRYDNGQIDEGRAFVYHGSVSGLSTTPDWTAESNQEDAYFGISVSEAGDVNGDGYSDVIVGASYYDNGQTDEGRAFVYHGSSSGLSTTPDWTVESNQADAYFGNSVSQAGDVNGDGYSDVIVGASYYDNGQTDEGRAFVYHGSGSGLSTTPDWTGESDQADAYFGIFVSEAGDVNGDGYSDVIVGAYLYDNGQTDEGRAYVYHGSSSGLSTTPDWTEESDQADAGFGISVSTAGDVNGDGYSDVIVGAWNYDNGQTNEGRAFVYHGSSSGLSITPDWTGESDQAYAYFGISVSEAGDVNGDGYSDVIVGASYYDNGQTDEGRAYVYHGSGSGLSDIPDWTGESDQAGAGFGYSVSTAGDVNGDGYSDVIVGAYFYDNGQIDEGGAFVYHGSNSGLSIAPNWTGESNQAGAEFGISVSEAGDVNGDGYSDVIVGAHYFDNGQDNEGRAFVYHGSNSGLSLTPDWTAESDQAYAFFGYSVSEAGDVDGDGYSDVIVGAYLYDNVQYNRGRAYVYHGSGSGLSTTPNWTAEAAQEGAQFGISVSEAGDVNGDGYSDVIVGAWNYDNGQSDEGRAFVYHGSVSGLSTTPNWTGESDQAGAYFGTSVSEAGDVNGDGYSDVIVGARLYDNGQTNEGRAYVYHGSISGLSTTPDWTAESDQAYAWFGTSVSQAGDVNGDGYSDVIVGASAYDNGQTDEGRAYVYHGSSSGLSTTPDWTGESDQIGAWFGNSVSSAGDVNGDGYSDVIVGAYYYDNGQADEGRAYVYHGSSSGLSIAPDWTAESNQGGAQFGTSVSQAGDVNGDGYSDVIVGAYWYDHGQTDEGGAFVYYGNSGGLALVPCQVMPDGSHLVQLLNATGSNEVRLKLIGRTPGGRGKVKLEWEIKELGQLMDGTNLGLSTGWYDTDISGIEISENITNLEDSTAYHWRVRLQYSPLTYNGSIYSRWLSIGPNGMNETDFITTALSGIEEEYTDLPDGFNLSINTPVSNQGFSIRYCIPEKEAVSARTSVSIKVYDKSGRLIKKIFEGRKIAGSYIAEWRGDDAQENKVPSGVYFIYLRCGEYKGIKKAILMR